MSSAALTVDPTVDRFADAANLLRGAAGIFTALAQVGSLRAQGDRGGRLVGFVDTYTGIFTALAQVGSL